MFTRIKDSRWKSLRVSSVKKERDKRLRTKKKKKEKEKKKKVLRPLWLLSDHMTQKEPIKINEVDWWEKKILFWWYVDLPWLMLAGKSMTVFFRFFFYIYLKQQKKQKQYKYNHTRTDAKTFKNLFTGVM